MSEETTSPDIDDDLERLLGESVEETSSTPEPAPPADPPKKQRAPRKPKSEPSGGGQNPKKRTVVLASRAWAGFHDDHGAGVFIEFTLNPDEEPIRGPHGEILLGTLVLTSIDALRALSDARLLDISGVVGYPVFVLQEGEVPEATFYFDGWWMGNDSKRWSDQPDFETGIKGLDTGDE